jgi:hypothetical protein
MSLSAVIEKMQRQALPHMEAVVREASADLALLLCEVSDVQCTAQEFIEHAEELTEANARTLLTATLHRSLAYGSQILPLSQARQLAQEFINAAGHGAKFYSTSHAVDEVNGVASWSLLVTTHTFESVLYCVGQEESALLVEIDED